MTDTSKSNNSLALIIVLGFIGFLIAIGGVCLVSYISASNTANSFEQQLKSVKENNENLLGQYGQKVVEAAQVTDMYRDDLTKVVREAIGGRYGAGGSKAVFQMLREQNPSLDASLYTKIQQIVESGRDEFQNGQTRMIDVKRAYSTALGTVWTGLWMRIAGYPKINLDDFKIVSTDRAQDAFRNGKESSPIQIRPASPVAPATPAAPTPAAQ